MTNLILRSDTSAMFACTMYNTVYHQSSVPSCDWTGQNRMKTRCAISAYRQFKQAWRIRLIPRAEVSSVDIVIARYYRLEMRPRVFRDNAQIEV